MARLVVKVIDVVLLTPTANIAAITDEMKSMLTAVFDMARNLLSNIFIALA